MGRDDKTFNSWIELLKSLPLSRSESDVMRRFEAEPEGRAFLPVADILRAHRLFDEALELLTQGVTRHPNFAVARVVLVRELYQKGMIDVAWQTLEESPVSLRSNVLAQKLRLKIALLLEMADVAQATVQSLKLGQMLDAETRRLSEWLEGKGLGAAREKLLAEFRERGVEPSLDLGTSRPPSMPSGSDRRGGGGSPSDEEFQGGAGLARGPLPSGPLSHGPRPGPLLINIEPVLRDPSTAGFHVSPLHEIFRPDQSAAPSSGAEAGIEMDSTTMADIYASQGHYAKALEVYRRILRRSPQNDLVRRRVAELARLEKEQKVEDLTLDPALVDRMEKLEVIDRQIKFYSQLLDKLVG